jgi:hypothetical protein
MGFDDSSELYAVVAAEKAAQLNRAQAVLLPLFIIAAVAVFAVCFWQFEIGLALSIGAALLTFPVLGLGVAVLIGYILGKRAARRLISRGLNEPGAI